MRIADVMYQSNHLSTAEEVSFLRFSFGAMLLYDSFSLPLVCTAVRDRATVIKP